MVTDLDPALTRTVGKVLVAYREWRELKDPRKARSFVRPVLEALSYGEGMLKGVIKP